jgi:flavin reductase (DIM6/NTAB) family NADH-FMN oxidoreductase RutF
MKKATLPPQSIGLVRAVLLVGANLEGRPNFMTCGGGGVVSLEPQLVAVPVRHKRHTLKGILENRTFSINVPPVSLARETDYCGLVSGGVRDKATDCGFKVFYGKLGNAPLIEECPANMECRVEHIISSTSHAIVIGRIEGCYYSEDCLVDGKPDLVKCDPLLIFMDNLEYITAGHAVARAYSVGKEFKPG